MKVWIATLALLAVGCRAVSGPELEGLQPTGSPLPFDLAEVGVLVDPELEQRERRWFGEGGTQEAWRVGLQSALRDLALFSEGAEREVVIVATILDLTFPTGGASQSACTRARYEVIDTATAETVFTWESEATEEVGMSFALDGYTRVREAIVQSTKSNLRQFLDELARAEL